MTHRKAVTTLAAITAAIASPAAALANPHNSLQPSNVYFGHVTAGQHPTRVVTVRNPTGAAATITAFTIAGSGGGKFTLVGHDAAGDASTCRVGMKLRDGARCTIIVRVKTTRPEWWQSVIDVWYRQRAAQNQPHQLTGAAPATTIGQWNGGVYAHVVAP